MFDEKTKCFIEQYSQFKVIGPNDEEAHVNGKVSTWISSHIKILTSMFHMHDTAHVV